jgi:hypothetical protein
MGQISVDVNNGGIMTLIQEKHDGSITLSSHGHEYGIDPGELVMLMNYFRNCKMGYEVSDYIQSQMKEGCGAITERAKFVLKCGELLKIAKPHLASCELKKGQEIPVSENKKKYEHYISGDEYVVVTCKNGFRYVLPVEGNTLNAIAEEIFRSMAYK